MEDMIERSGSVESAGMHGQMLDHGAEGQDGQAWSLSPHSHSQLWFFNVPNVIAASPAALLLPREMAVKDGIP